MNDTIYARLRDALARQATDDVAAELLALSKSDVADFFRFSARDRTPLLDECVRRMRTIEATTVAPSGLPLNERGDAVGAGRVIHLLREIHRDSPDLGEVKCVDPVAGEVVTRLRTYGPEVTYPFRVHNDALFYRGHVARL